jgi:hypothetical protein
VCCKFHPCTIQSICPNNYIFSWKRLSSRRKPHVHFYDQLLFVINFIYEQCFIPRWYTTLMHSIFHSCFFFHQSKVSNLIHFTKFLLFHFFLLTFMFPICLFLFTPNQTKNTLLHIKHLTYNGHIDDCKVSKLFYKIIAFMMDTRTKYVEHQFQFSNSICDQHGYIKFHSCVLEQPFQC